MDSLRSWHGFGVRELSDAYGDPMEDYHHNLSLPEFENGSYDPDNAYRGHCNEVGCPCKYYCYDTGTGCTNIRSMCNHTPLQHAHGRPPVPKSPIERIRSGPYPNPAFNGPVGQSFSVEYILIRFLVFVSCTIFIASDLEEIRCSKECEWDWLGTRTFKVPKPLSMFPMSSYFIHFVIPSSLLAT